MIILSAFNKGGVGKTTLAVHVAGLLAENGRVLLVDCVDQFDAFSFYCRQEPKSEFDSQRAKNHEGLTVIWNPDQTRITRLVEPSEYEHIVLDINSPNEDTVKVIVENEPDIILLPINDQALALDKLADTLAIVAAMQKTNYQSRVRIVPLGAIKTRIEECLAQIAVKPTNIQLTKRIKKHPKEFPDALQTGQFVWHYEGCEYIRDILQETIQG
ncbi:MAG: ParA family protein [Candidatus Parabeggiatoa sp. nov. 3]|nr:MAG: ParA family protein [Gammaproteobacteria bacterium]RKZ59154.1 MAG: ParA family protein [Gammaproteobacteria bacterium]